jgi:hypothetical protein
VYQHRTSDLDLAGATGKAHEVGGEVLIDDAPEVSSATQITRDGITLRGASGTGSVNVEGGTKTALYVWRPQTDFPVVLVNAQHTRLIDLPIVIREPRPGSFAVLVGGSDYVGELGMTNCYLASSPASSMEGYGLGVFRGLKGTLVDCWIGGWRAARSSGATPVSRSRRAGPTSRAARSRATTSASGASTVISCSMPCT